MKDKKGLFEHETENVSTELNDHVLDCILIDRTEEQETTEGAQG